MRSDSTASPAFTCSSTEAEQCRRSLLFMPCDVDLSLRVEYLLVRHYNLHDDLLVHRLGG